MTNSQICSNCTYKKHEGYTCCHIYKRDNRHISEEIRSKSREEISKWFHPDKSVYGVEEIEQENKEKCEYLGEQGCIIDYEKRPKICQDYRCFYLSVHKSVAK